MKQWKEKGMEILFLLAACVSILAVILICVFLFANGIPGMAKIGIFKFLAGEKWKPGNDIYGILPMILGSIYVTVGAIIIGVPVGIFTAVFMAKFCPKKIYPYLKQAIDLLAGIPSVVYGFFGLVVIVPMVRELTDALHAVGDGTGILTASILLGLMILPTIIGVTESAVRSVPESYYEGSLALGATKERSIFFVMLPAAKSGILAGVVLGIGRAIALALCRQSGDDQSGTGPQVVSLDRCTGELFHALYHGGLVIHLNTGAHALEFIHIAVAAAPDTLGH